MAGRYLEVTYRKGKPLAAYYYLPREPGAAATTTRDLGDGLIADLADDGRPLGIEITAPQSLTLDRLNHALATLDQPPAPALDLQPLHAAA
ncbi:MAG: DUF2283 domain-containing protein [Planctomycetota bacterium]